MIKISAFTVIGTAGVLLLSHSISKYGLGGTLRLIWEGGKKNTNESGSSPPAVMTFNLVFRDHHIHGHKHKIIRLDEIRFMIFLFDSSCVLHFFFFSHSHSPFFT